MFFLFLIIADRCQRADVRHSSYFQRATRLFSLLAGVFHSGRSALWRQVLQMRRRGQRTLQSHRKGHDLKYLFSIQNFELFKSMKTSWPTVMLHTSLGRWSS